jgi:hypothetical protein
MTPVPPAPAGALVALDAVVTRHGPDVLADPLALEAALRAATVPLLGPQFAALVGVAGTAAVARMRAALAERADPDAVLAAGVDAAGVDAAADPAAVSWACAMLGAALGYLPRATARGAAPPGAAPPAARRRRPGRIVLAAAVLALLAGAGAYLLLRPAEPAPRPTGADLVGSPVAGPAAPAATPTPVPPADPLLAFRDPELRALAEPYLRGPGASCEAQEIDVQVRDNVDCDLGGGRVAIFTRYLSTEFMQGIRGGFLDSDDGRGDIRSLRWRFVDRVAGTRVGIPPTSGRPGEGRRIRFVQDGLPLLWFDQDATACVALLGLNPPSGDAAADLDALRSFWADPNR